MDLELMELPRVQRHAVHSGDPWKSSPPPSRNSTDANRGAVLQHFRLSVSLPAADIADVSTTFEAETFEAEVTQRKRPAPGFRSHQRIARAPGPRARGPEPQLQMSVCCLERRSLLPSIGGAGS